VQFAHHTDSHHHQSSIIMNCVAIFTYRCDTGTHLNAAEITAAMYKD